MAENVTGNMFAIENVQPLKFFAIIIFAIVNICKKFPRKRIPVSIKLHLHCTNG